MTAIKTFGRNPLRAAIGVVVVCLTAAAFARAAAAQTAKITVSPKTATVEVGKTKALSRIVTVVWKSSDTTIATVTQVGLITARKQGVTTVTVSAGGLSASSVITVVPPPVVNFNTAPHEQQPIALASDACYQNKRMYARGKLTDSLQRRNYWLLNDTLRWINRGILQLEARQDTLYWYSSTARKADGSLVPACQQTWLRRQFVEAPSVSTWEKVKLWVQDNLIPPAPARVVLDLSRPPQW